MNIFAQLCSCAVTLRVEQIFGGSQVGFSVYLEHFYRKSDSADTIVMLSAVP